MVVGTAPTFTGCVMTVRLVGVIEALQRERRRTIRNDRLIGTPKTPKIRPDAQDLGDLPSGMLEQIEHFFVAYNRFEGRQFMPQRRRGPGAAAKRLEKAIRSA
jgi:inorganic pyrophosphatase